MNQETNNEAPAAEPVEAEAAEAVVAAAATDEAPEGSILGDAKPGGESDDGATADASAAADGDGDAVEAGGDPLAAADADTSKPYEGLTAPEGFALDDDTMALATPLMREFGVADDKAQAFVEKAAPIMERAGTVAVERFVQAQVDQHAQMKRDWAEQTRSDPEIGGAKFDESVAMAAKARDMLFPPSFVELLNATGYGNHPDMIRGLAMAGRQLAEDTVVVPSAIVTSAPKTLGTALYGDMKPVNPE